MTTFDQSTDAPPAFEALEAAVEAKAMNAWDEFLLDLGSQIHEDPERNALLTRVVELVVGVQELIEWNAGVVLALIGCEATVEDDPVQTYSVGRLHVAITRLEQLRSVLVELAETYSPSEAREVVSASAVGFGFLYQRKWEAARAWVRLGPQAANMTPAQVRASVASVCAPALRTHMRQFASSMGASSSC